VQETLAGYNQGRGPNRFPVIVAPGQLKYVVINASFGYDSTYLEADVMQAVQKALGVNSGKPTVVDDQSGLFSVRRRSFGQPEYATSVAGTIQQIKGVVWAQVTRFESLGLIIDPTTFTPPGSPIVVQPTVICEPGNLLSLYSGHLQLTGVAEARQEVS